MNDQPLESAEAIRLARKAVDLGADDPFALSMGAYALAFVAREFDDAADFMDRALAVNPNLARAWMLSAWLRVRRGEPDLVLEHCAHAMRLSPLDPSMYYTTHSAMAYAHFLAGRHDIALSCAEKAMRDNPAFLLTICIYAASGVLAGRMEPASQSHLAGARRQSWSDGIQLERVDAISPAGELRNLCESSPQCGSSGLTRGWYAATSTACA